MEIAVLSNVLLKNYTHLTNHTSHQAKAETEEDMFSAVYSSVNDIIQCLANNHADGASKLSLLTSVLEILQ